MPYHYPLYPRGHAKPDYRGCIREFVRFTFAAIVLAILLGAPIAAALWIWATF